MKIALVDLLPIVAEQTGVSVASILSKSRVPEVIDARRISIKLLFDNGYKAEVIAAIFGLTESMVYRHIQRQIELLRIYKTEKLTYQKCESLILSWI